MTSTAALVTVIAIEGAFGRGNEFVRFIGCGSKFEEM